MNSKTVVILPKEDETHINLRNLSHAIISVPGQDKPYVLLNDKDQEFSYDKL